MRFNLSRSVWIWTSSSQCLRTASALPAPASREQVTAAVRPKNASVPRSCALTPSACRCRSTKAGGSTVLHASMWHRLGRGLTHGGALPTCALTACADLYAVQSRTADEEAWHRRCRARRREGHADEVGQGQGAARRGRQAHRLLSAPRRAGPGREPRGGGGGAPGRRGGEGALAAVF